LDNLAISDSLFQFPWDPLEFQLVAYL